MLDQFVLTGHEALDLQCVMAVLYAVLALQNIDAIDFGFDRFWNGYRNDVADL